MLPTNFSSCLELVSPLNCLRMQVKTRGTGNVSFTQLASHGVHYNLKRTARVVTNFYDRALRDVGLKSTQFSVLTCVHVHGGSTVDELALHLDLDGTSLTRALKTLKEAGFVSMHPGADRRTRIAELTEAGRRKLVEAYPVWRRIQRHFMRGLGRENWRRLKEQLEIIHELAEA